MWGHDRDPGTERHEPIGPSFRAVAPTPKGGWLLVNPHSGDGSGVDELRAAAAARGLDTHLLRPGEDATTLARGARAEALGIGGGRAARVRAAAGARDGARCPPGCGAAARRLTGLINAGARPRRAAVRPGGRTPSPPAARPGRTTRAGRRRRPGAARRRPRRATSVRARSSGRRARDGCRAIRAAGPRG